MGERIWLGIELVVRPNRHGFFCEKARFLELGSDDRHFAGSRLSNFVRVRAAEPLELVKQVIEFLGDCAGFDLAGLVQHVNLEKRVHRILLNVDFGYARRLDCRRFLLARGEANGSRAVDVHPRELFAVVVGDGGSPVVVFPASIAEPHFVLRAAFHKLVGPPNFCPERC
jgi:hypothetical protein